MSALFLSQRVVRYLVVLSCAAALLSVPANARETLIRVDQQDGAYLPVTGDGQAVLIREDSEIEELEGQVSDQEQRIQKTEEEIKKINGELNQIYKKKDSLEGELQSLTLTNRKNEVQIEVTEKSIKQSELKLEILSSSIENNNENIQTLHSILIKNYQRANEFEMNNERTAVILNPSFFDVLQGISDIERYSGALQQHLVDIKQETKVLEENTSQVKHERVALTGQQYQLEDRKRIYQSSIKEKEVLVQETRSDELVFQKLLREKQEERLQLYQRLVEFESRIEYLQDPDSIPKPRPGILRLPFSERYPLTQGFGATAFAKANTHRYGGAFHSGIDFGTPSGTPLLATASGIIVGEGNTDSVRSCQSWGKWLIIEHPFGLSTLYAHLSLTKVRIGQKVEAGELIGYSGNTGFSTGPHLHLGLYDSSGLRIIPGEKISTLCRGIPLPVSAPGARLNPRDYLVI